MRILFGFHVWLPDLQGTLQHGPFFQVHCKIDSFERSCQDGNDEWEREPETHCWLLYELTSVGSIHKLSSVRTLQLLNAHTCELCRIKPIAHARESWAACWDCTGCFTKLVYCQRPNERRHYIETDVVMHNQRVASRFIRKIERTFSPAPFNRADFHFVWTKRIIQPSVFSDNGEERVGPIVVLEDIRKFEETFHRQKKLLPTWATSWRLLLWRNTMSSILPFEQIGYFRFRLFTGVRKWRLMQPHKQEKRGFDKFKLSCPSSPLTLTKRWGKPSQNMTLCLITRIDGCQLESWHASASMTTLLMMRWESMF